MTIKRKLFFLERLLHLNGDTSIAPKTLAISLSFKGNIPHERVKIALEKLQKKHPSLRARIKGKYIYYEDTDYPPIPLKIVDRISDDTWITERDKYFTHPFDFEKGPLLRVLWVKSDEISNFSFIGLHVVIDGKSLFILLRDFFIFLNDPNREAKPYLPVQSLKELFPDISLTWKEKLTGNIWTEIMRWKLFFATWNKRVKPLQSYSLSSSLGEETTLALKTVSAKHNVSAGDVLCVIVARLFKAHFHPVNPQCTIFIPLDVRRFTSFVKKDMIFGFAPVIIQKINLSNDADFWEQVHSFENELINKTITLQKTHSHSIKHSITRGFVFMEYYNRIINLFIKRSLTVQENTGFTFINLGLIALPTVKNAEYKSYNAYTRSEARFPGYNSTNFGIGNVFDVNLEFDFFSNEKFIPKKEMQLILSEFEQAVKALVKEETDKGDNQQN